MIMTANSQIATNNDFYEQCATILGSAHKGQPFPHWYRTRWNNRVAGRGRFEGRGIIRCFGDNVQIALTNPELHIICVSKTEALEKLSNAVLNASADGFRPDATNVGEVVQLHSGAPI